MMSALQNAAAGVEAAAAKIFDISSNSNRVTCSVGLLRVIIYFTDYKCYSGGAVTGRKPGEPPNILVQYTAFPIEYQLWICYLVGGMVASSYVLVSFRLVTLSWKETTGVASQSTLTRCKSGQGLHPIE
jgi:hypothetical protein